MNIDRGNDGGGFRLTDRSWADELGTWSSAVTPDGRPASALRFDPRRTADPAARDRLVAAVVADRELTRAGLTGLLPVADLITAHGEIWLLTAAPVNPTLDDLLTVPGGALRPDAGGAATVLLETARTLLAVHAAGLSHGALRPGNVTIAADGSVLLVARGLADALEGRLRSPERDAAAWAALARELAAGRAGAGRAAEVFERAAATASAHGLAPARDVLLDGRDLLSPGFPEQSGLAETARAWAGHAAPVAGAAASAVFPASPAPSASTAAVPDEGEIVTLLHVPRTGEGPVAGAGPAVGTAGAGSVAGTTGVAGAGDPEVVMRFGPGVPPETTAAQIWRAGRDQQQTEPPSSRLRALGAPARRRRRRTALAAAILALMVAGILAIWLLRTPSAPLAITGLKVSAPKKTQGCDTTVRIMGTLVTNGSAGEVRYQWRRSDRKTPIEQTDTVPAGETSHEVSLEWTVKGEGSFKGTATLRVISPAARDGKLQDKASFTYRCS
ncbi:hypothetical protein GCM10017673_13630 [Streptosporangium violaceochromogenes]|nr:hypothetical protein GCM10017673_13630 [Streptosporangium violaceochromogenes]